MGPIDEFTALSDMIFFATVSGNDSLQFSALSGKPPLVQFSDGQDLIIRLSSGMPALAAGTKVGGLSINMTQARPARVNSIIAKNSGAQSLLAEETFTLCRKYIAASLLRGDELLVGPAQREPIALGGNCCSQRRGHIPCVH